MIYLSHNPFRKKQSTVIPKMVGILSFKCLIGLFCCFLLHGNSQADPLEDLTYSVWVTRGEIRTEASRKIYLPVKEISLHPGFEQGVPIGDGLVQSSIGIGDIDQDGLGEIVVGGADGSLFGYNDDGTPVLPGFSGPPGSLFTALNHAPILSTPTLADVDYDHRDDIFFGSDAGILYHLELRLSSDPVGTLSPAVRAVCELPLQGFSSSLKSQPSAEEGDDVGNK